MERRGIIDYKVLWERISAFARKTGRVTTRPVLLLYFVLRSKEPSWKDKMLIFSTLSYVVLPIDILDARRLPVIGWLDEDCLAVSRIREGLQTHHTGDGNESRCNS